MRLITRSDFDGLVTAVLLKKVEQIDEIVFAHPKDMQDGKIEVNSNDIITNLPFVDGVGIWFDHHFSEIEKHTNDSFKGRVEMAPSTARVIVNHYGEDNFTDLNDMIIACDKVDSANLTFDEILNPKDWILLSYIMDSRTGLGYYHDYKISNYELMMKLIESMSTQTIQEIYEDPDVKQRLDRYAEQSLKFHVMLRENTKMYGDCCVTDLRGISETISGNRFHIYTIFPDANISIRIIDGKNKEFVVFALGHSILNRTSKFNIGETLSTYGGGGHVGAGTCQVPYDQAEKVLSEIIEKINS